jgi:hypothetical protein
VKRIDLAFKRFPGYCASEIIDMACPVNVDELLPDINIDDYKWETECVEKGCRGITCYTCWQEEMEIHLRERHRPRD